MPSPRSRVQKPAHNDLGPALHRQPDREHSRSLPEAVKTTQPAHTDQLIDSDNLSISTKDIIIAVMGPTGAGKSSFINLAMKRDATVVGHGLKSCTQDVRAVGCPHPDGSGRNVFLVDTPGFDDTDTPDSVILDRIAEWLAATYRRHITLSGLLYLHRISDDRLGGTPLRNLSVFKKLCGRDTLQNVILATTMWDEVNEKTGTNREKQLRKGYWRSMTAHGSRITRHDNNSDSAWKIINLFTNTSRRPVELQVEMVDQGKELMQTKAGSGVFEWWGKIIENFREVLRKLEARMQGISNDTSLEAIGMQHSAVKQKLKEAAAAFEREQRAAKRRSGKLRRNSSIYTTAKNAVMALRLRGSSPNPGAMVSPSFTSGSSISIATSEELPSSSTRTNGRTAPSWHLVDEAEYAYTLKGEGEPLLNIE